jgi:hypothetical protein
MRLCSLTKIFTFSHQIHKMFRGTRTPASPQKENTAFNKFFSCVQHISYLCLPATLNNYKLRMSNCEFNSLVIMQKNLTVVLTVHLETMIHTFMYLLRKTWKEISNTRISQCLTWINQL